ncbi:MAG: class I SAM-dependent methyltransferase [bacterium]|nr:class I SAM-dependent methyltransferase [bacterium]
MTDAFAVYRRIYRQGAAMGRRHFNRRGIACAGLKRSLGFVIQPVENWSRYPELATALDLMDDIRPGSRILDLGSPKMLGLILADRHPATFVLTDIWPEAVDEIRELVAANRKRLQGEVELGTADLTDLRDHATCSYDWLYSVSVIEHIEDLEATRRGLREMVRVLAPGGRAIISVPVEPIHRKAYRENGVYGREGDGEQAFFSHYFDKGSLTEILESIPDLQLTDMFYSRWHDQALRMRCWTRVPQKIRGILGPVNLILAPSAATVTRESMDDLQIDSNGDIILRFRKAAVD